MNKMALFAIIGTAMFLLGGGVSFAATPSGPVHIQPNPALSTNITWSTFYNGWTPLEYNNGTGNQSLNTDMSNYYNNPISINPTGIIALGSLQNENVTGHYWNNLSYWSTQSGTAADGSITSYKTINNDKATYISETSNTSASGSDTIGLAFSPLTSQLPSNNPAYDFITVIYGLTGKAMTGVEATITISNGTSPNYYKSITPNEIGYFTVSLKQLSSSGTAQFNITGKGALSQLQIEPNIYLPQAASTSYTMTVYGFAITTEPYTLGTYDHNGTATPLTNSTGTAQLNSFNPSFAWQEVGNNSYSVATSQPLQTETTQQNAISSGNYIEQVEYQGEFDLPTAPDLSYGSANLTEQFNISTAQTQVLDINGVSYLSTISGKNGTIQLLSPVNPNSQIQFLQIVDYTQSQWNTISNSPGLFTLAGIEYYWWIAVGGLATLIGLGAAAKHAGTKADQERIRRGR